jgi:hypothetical protein
MWLRGNKMSYFYFRFTHQPFTLRGSSPAPSVLPQASYSKEDVHV